MESSILNPDDLFHVKGDFCDLPQTGRMYISISDSAKLGLLSLRADQEEKSTSPLITNLVHLSTSILVLTID